MISILPESNYAAVMTETVEPYLDSRRQEMDMPLSTGGTLHAEVYEQPDATRAVVILHGYTESAEKFREMTWYFLNEKFNVYAIDHRGHGKSVRKFLTPPSRTSMRFRIICAIWRSSCRVSSCRGRNICRACCMRTRWAARLAA